MTGIHYKDFQVAPHLALADWRRRVQDLYTDVRRAQTPYAGWTLWHKTRSALFAHHPMSPLPATRREGFTEIAVFDYDPALRFEVSTIALTGAYQTFELGDDGSMRCKPLAQTDGLVPYLGAELTLYWIGGYGGGLFLPFRDASNTSETYGGGRYILDAIKGADLGISANGKLILDFNFAYNPSCSLSPAYVCPLPPPENTLPVPVRGGELLNHK